MSAKQTKGDGAVSLKNREDLSTAGDGIVVDVYEDEIVVRARDFVKGEWIEGLRYTY